MLKKAYIIFGIFLFILPTWLPSLQRLPEARAEDVGMSSLRLARLDDVIQEALEEKHFPGAVLVVGRRGRIVWRKAYGDRQWLPQRRPMELSLVFDLASLTKPIATTTSILLLVERGKIRLWDKVEEFVTRVRQLIESGSYTSEKKLRVKFDDFGEFGLHILVNFFLDVSDVDTEKAERQRIFLEILKLAETMGIQFAVPPRFPTGKN